MASNTLGYLIKVQVLINVQGGISPEKKKRAGPNRAVLREKSGKIKRCTILQIQSLINVQGEFWFKRISVQALMRPCSE